MSSPVECTHCGLTPRSSGAPTASRQRPAGGTRYIFAVRALAACRRRSLSSNVRPHKQVFADCRQELEAYGAWLVQVGMSVKADHLLQEVRLRLRQLSGIYGRCMLLDSEFERLARASMPSEGDVPGVFKQIFHEQSFRGSSESRLAYLQFQPQDELWVWLESFYYSAHRVRDILRDNRQVLPGLHTFEAVGVRTARNHLIEHTASRGGVLVPSIACGGPVGPQLRSVRWSLDEKGSSDPGLKANAIEFAGNLRSVLQRARSAA